MYKKLSFGEKANPVIIVSFSPGYKLSRIVFEVCKGACNDFGLLNKPVQRSKSAKNNLSPWLFTPPVAKAYLLPSLLKQL